MRSSPVVCVLVLAVLTGCGSGTAEPQPAGSTLAAPVGGPGGAGVLEAQESRAPDMRPALPAEAERRTPEGAVAFATWWFATLTYAAATGDTESLRGASTPSCATCASYAADIEQAYRGGGRMEGPRVTVVDASPDEPDGEGIRLRVTVDVSEVRYLDAAGVQVGESLAGRDALPLTFDALLTDTGWMAGGVHF